MRLKTSDTEWAAHLFKNQISGLDRKLMILLYNSLRTKWIMFISTYLYPNLC